MRTDGMDAETDAWAEELTGMNQALRQPTAVAGANRLVVPCPQCQGPIEVDASDRIQVTVRPGVRGENWQTTRVTITASGTTLHTHNIA